MRIGTPSPLRPVQATALDLLRNSLRSGRRRPILQMPTGGGKTVIGAHIVTGLLNRQKRVCFSVPALGLVDQTFERFTQNGIDPANMGVLQGAHPWRRLHAPLQIATPQTLSRRTLPDVQYVIVDEAHIRFKVIDRWIAERPEVVFIGLSATPWSRGLGKLYDDLLKPTSLNELIDLGLLSPFRVFAPTHPDLSGVSIVAGDYHEGELAEAMNRPTLVADIVTTWLARGRGRPTLVFATGRMHAQALRDRFAEVGVSAAYVDANTPREERDQIGRDLAIGRHEVVVNVGCLTTGIDWDVRCIVLARPTRSEMLFVQIIGRGLRTAPGKTDCLILDHSDTHLRLGMVTDIDCDVLDDGRPRKQQAEKREKKQPLPKECDSCGCLVPPLMKECPACGHERKIATVQEADGDLVEMVREGIITRPVPGMKVTDMLRELGGRDTYRMIRWIGDERGRAPGWSAHAYKALWGDWPPNGFERMNPAEPCPLMRGWIRSRDIAFAKSKRSTGAAHAAE
jgi:superfamily II DNA or RNA helicase